MGKALKYAVLFGVAGAGYSAVQATRRDEDSDLVVTNAMKTGGQAALAGLAVGLVAGRRSKRKAKKQALKAAAKGGAFLEAARFARPVVETALEAMASAADAARPKLEHAADVARPKVEHAAKVAKDKAEHAADVARPKVEHAAKLAKTKAFDVADAAGTKVEHLAHRDGNGNGKRKGKKHDGKVLIKVA